MSKLCYITKKKPIFGNNRSHSLNATKRKFLPNIQYKKIWVSEKKRFIKVKISTKGIKTIDKFGTKKFFK
ncbi:50S ribosomal protein L28 [Buchnera aphidicola]|uniref:50S ribosomal protein L28 n=1 Tax=Buchnera aphidicola TaxID=9 RepID=UPI0034648119